MRMTMNDIVVNQYIVTSKRSNQHKALKSVATSRLLEVGYGRLNAVEVCGNLETSLEELSAYLVPLHIVLLVVLVLIFALLCTHTCGKQSSSARATYCTMGVLTCSVAWAQTDKAQCRSTYRWSQMLSKYRGPWGQNAVSQSATETTQAKSTHGYDEESDAKYPNKSYPLDLFKALSLHMIQDLPTTNKALDRNIANDKVHANLCLSQSM